MVGDQLDQVYLSDEQLMSLLESGVNTTHQIQPRCPAIRFTTRPLPVSHRVIDESEPPVAIMSLRGLYEQHML